MAQEKLHATTSEHQYDQQLFDLLNTYAHGSILFDKDQTAKLMLLRVFLKKELKQILATDSSITFKQAIIKLLQILPDDAREDAFHVAVSVASDYWPQIISASLEVEIMVS